MPELSTTVTKTLFKTDRLKVIRCVVSSGKDIPFHKVAGEITVQCGGASAFTALGETQEMHAGQMLHLSGGTEHSVKGIDDASLLVTILL